LPDPVNGTCDGVRFQRYDDAILNTQFGRIVRARQSRYALLVFDLEPEPVRPDGGQMNSSGHEADLCGRPRKLDAEEAADCAGSEYADLQERSPRFAGRYRYLKFMVYHTPECNKKDPAGDYQPSPHLFSFARPAFRLS
jgi:hypothetical protein